MFTYIYPPQSVSVATPPIQFLKDGIDVTVSLDTGTPLDSNPLPVIQLDSSGNPATPLTDTQLRASPVPVSGPLTDTQLRATAVPISGTVTANTGLSQPLTDAQLRATAVPVSAASLPLPSGAATESTLNSVRVGIELIDDTIVTSGGAASARILAVGGHTGSTSHAWHVDSAGLGRVDVRASVLPTGAATAANQSSELTLIGAVTETAPATDTASSGLNGRLQRIAQRITSLIALIPASLGQKTMANSFAVTLASDQSALSTTQTALTASYQEITNLTTVAQTFTAPAGAKWCKIYCPDTNVANVRVRLAGTATITSGIQFQPGRSEDFNAVGNISVIAESGTNQVINVHFGV